MVKGNFANEGENHMLYVTRHGETTWNAQGLVCGRADVPLTEKGQMQAQKLAEKVVICLFQSRKSSIPLFNEQEIQHKQLLIVSACR